MTEEVLFECGGEEADNLRVEELLFGLAGIYLDRKTSDLRLLQAPISSLPLSLASPILLSSLPALHTLMRVRHP